MPPFWQTKSLAELSPQEWESLCDGCGRCCLHKLEDEDTGELFHTRVACRLLDTGTARCKDYRHRRASVPDCIRLTPALLAKAFRGELTADWRAANPHLISGENSAQALLAKIKAERDKPKKTSKQQTMFNE